MPELEVGLGIISIGLATRYQPAAPVQRTSGRSIQYPTPIGTQSIYTYDSWLNLKPITKSS